MARPKQNQQPDITQHVTETFESPIDVKRHDVPERHAFGEAFLAPSDLDVSPTGPAPQTGSAGTSEKFARADHRHAFEGGGGSGGVTDHGQLNGLGDDDHPQYTQQAEAESIANAAVVTHEGKADPHPNYLTAAEGNGLYDPAGAAASGDSAHVAAGDPHPQYLTPAEGNAAYAPTAHNHDAAYLSPAEILAGTNVVVDRTATTVTINATPGGSGVTDHGLLTGLADDDHPQYLTQARADALFLTPAEGDAAYLSPTEIVAGAGIATAVAAGAVTISVPMLARYPRGVMGYAAASVGAGAALSNGQKVRVWTINALALKAGRLYQARWGLRALTGPAGSSALFTRDYVANPGTATINLNLDHYLAPVGAIWTGGTHYMLFVVSADAIVDIGINIQAVSGAINIWPDSHHFVVEDVGPNPSNPPT